MNLKAISLGKNAPHDVNVVIEVPIGGEPIKYEIDKEAGALVVDRFLYTSMRYPGNYGFIPHTLSDDGDPCDVIIANTRAIIPGAIMSVRPVGVLIMEDESGGDEKIVARIAPGVVVIDLPGLQPGSGFLVDPAGSHHLREISPEELSSLTLDSPHYEQGDYVGRRGIERRYERELKGKDGIERIVVDAKGQRKRRQGAGAQHRVRRHQRHAVDAGLQPALRRAVAALLQPGPSTARRRKETINGRCAQGAGRGAELSDECRSHAAASGTGLRGNGNRP